MKLNKVNLVIIRIVASFFVLVCSAYMLDVLNFNIISYFWPVVFVTGIVFGIFVIKSLKKNRLFDNIFAIIIVFLCMASLSFYGFWFFIGRVMGG